MAVITERKEVKQKRKDYLKGNIKSKRNQTILLSFFILSITVSSGCLETNLFESSTTYEESPVQISYDFTYGYNLNLTGSGEANVFYQEYLPQSNKGIIYSVDIIPNQYRQKEHNTNKLITWNQSIQDEYNQSYFIRSSILQNPIIIEDLIGKNALTIDEIHLLHPEISATYCHSLGNETQTIIDPKNPLISTLAQSLNKNSDESNAFILGKQLFSWLKNHTSYEKHQTYQPQPALTTYETGVGDCDDLTYLYLSLCKAVGIPSRYIKGYLISNNTAVPHVWAELFVGPKVSETGWIPVECAGTGSSTSEIHNNYGIEDVQHIRLCIDDGTNETFQNLTNPLQIRYEQSLEVNINRVEIITNYTVLSSKQLIIKNNERSFE